MRYRLRDIIDSIEYDELVKMKKDLENGGFHLKQFVEHKIKEEEKKHEVHCSNCSTKIDPKSSSTFTLIFGPDDFKKKATFCGMDCLEYFLKELKQIRREVR